MAMLVPSIIPHSHAEPASDCTGHVCIVYSQIIGCGANCQPCVVVVVMAVGCASGNGGCGGGGGGVVDCGG
eukprot:7622817-Pyramimonas_sp.AAC.1